jgi:hypothetical protein
MRPLPPIRPPTKTSRPPSAASSVQVLRVFVNPFMGFLSRGYRAVGALRKSAGEVDPVRDDSQILRGSTPTGNSSQAKVTFRIRNS